MRYPIFLVLYGGITAVTAQTATGSSSSSESSVSITETSPLLFQTNGDGDSTDFSVSVVGNSGSTTTYLVSCAEAGSINCNFDTATVVGGPSTVAMYYNYDDTVTYSLGCNIVDSSSSAACVMSEGGSGLDGTSFLSSFTVPASAVALGFITDASSATTTAAAAAAATDAATSTTAASTRSSPTVASVMSTATPGGTTSLTGSASGSATGTAAASQTSETKKSAAVGRFSGASCRWVAVGAVVAALGLML